jgi:glucose-1-phosphate adenylyltransferase
MMGADYYEAHAPKGVPALGIGRDCYLRNAIVDKNARIGDGAYITPDGKGREVDHPLYSVRDGVIVIPKNAVIPPGTRI